MLIKDDNMLELAVNQLLGSRSKLVKRFELGLGTNPYIVINLGKRIMLNIKIFFLIVVSSLF